MLSPLVEKFCTIPQFPFTDFDKKAISDADMFEISFEGKTIQCYSWGKGKTVLLAHGWGSRASHFAALIRVLTSSGFHVVAYDSPGHSSKMEINDHRLSNMFEFYRAVSTVAKQVSNIYGIVGHSLGAAASVLAVTDHMKFCDYKINIEKLVLISSPAGVESIINNFCRNNNLDEKTEDLLSAELTRDFHFKAEDCSIAAAIKNVEADILVVHDSDDNEIPIQEAEMIIDACKKVKTCFTKGAGHYKILTNRTMLSSVNKFFVGH